MNRDDALRLTAVMVTAWPASRIPVETLEHVWLPRLAEQTYDWAMEAVDLLVDHEEFFPAWSTYLTTYRDVARRRAAQRPAVRQLEEAPASPQVAAEWQAKIRQQLRDAPGPLAAPLRETTAAVAGTPSTVTGHATEALSCGESEEVSDGE